MDKKLLTKKERKILIEFDLGISELIRNDAIDKSYSEGCKVIEKILRR